MKQLLQRLQGLLPGVDFLLTNPRELLLLAVASVAIGLAIGAVIS